MKNKKWITLATAVVLAVTALPLGVFAAKKDEAKLAKVTLNEVAHSIFYAPQYVAIEEGYFKDEGLDMTLITGCDVKSLNLIVWRTIRPNQPFRWLKSSPLAMSVMTLFKSW